MVAAGVALVLVQGVVAAAACRAAQEEVTTEALGPMGVAVGSRSGKILCQADRMLLLQEGVGAGAAGAPPRPLGCMLLVGVGAGAAGASTTTLGHVQLLLVGAGAAAAETPPKALGQVLLLVGTGAGAAGAWTQTLRLDAPWAGPVLVVVEGRTAAAGGAWKSLGCV
jgi:hypothetical protein